MVKPPRFAAVSLKCIEWKRQEVTMAVRMKDIAKDLGVSIVTVSKVFNNHKDIGTATRERVLRRIKELNYQPSLHAQGLASGQSFMVGLVVPDLVHAFFSEVAKSISTVIRKEGYGLVISSSNDNPRLEHEELLRMMRHRVDALVVASCQETSKQLREIGAEVPLILLDRRYEDFEANFVGTNDFLVGQMATEHLIDRGFRRIAYIGGKKASTSLGRLEGYRQALRHHGISVPESYIVRRRHSDESGDTTGCQAMEKLLRVKPRPDAVFCFNDPAAVGAMNAILAAGLRIPEDIALIGAGNIRYAESFRVPLSSIDVSCNALGEHVGNLVIQLTARKKSARPKAIMVQPRLIARDSTRAKMEQRSGVA
jgi:LacI family transcriptional regulator